MTYPADLDEAVAHAIAQLRHGSLRGGMDDLSLRYKHGGQSKGADLASYLAARLPATFAATTKVLSYVAEQLPNFAPQSAIDVGAGPGTASWAALQHWPTLKTLAQMETAPDLASLAKTLNTASGHEVLKSAVQHAQSIASPIDSKSFDVVIATYVLAEVHNPDVSKAVSNLIAMTAGVLIVVEPGTPHGFSRIMRVRELALRHGLHMVGPCTHAVQCPLAEKDWCHFKTRVQRSRDHMHAKGATVPFEDEPFSWIAFSREDVELSGARVIAQPQHSKPGIDFKLCSQGKILTHHIASRDKASYKAAKKTEWGDRIGIET